MLEQPHIMHPYFFVEDNKESPLFPMIQDFYSKIMARKKNKERDCWSYKPIPYECFPEYGKVGMLQFFVDIFFQLGLMNSHL